MIDNTMTHRCYSAEPVQPTSGVDPINEAGHTAVVAVCIVVLFVLAVIGVRSMLDATERAEKQITQSKTRTTHVIQCAESSHPAVIGKE